MGAQQAVRAPGAVLNVQPRRRCRWAVHRRPSELTCAVAESGEQHDGRRSSRRLDTLKLLGPLIPKRRVGCCYICRGFEDGRGGEQA